MNDNDLKLLNKREFDAKLNEIRRYDGKLFEEIVKKISRVTTVELDSILTKLKAKESKEARNKISLKEASIRESIKYMYQAQTVKPVKDDEYQIVLLEHKIPTTAKVIRLQRALLTYSLGYSENIANTVRSIIMDVNVKAVKMNNLKPTVLTPEIMADSLVADDSKENYIHNEIVKVIKEILVGNE